MYCYTRAQLHVSAITFDHLQVVHERLTLPASHKKFQYLNSKEFLYKIAFTYVTFADIWIGRHYVIAIDYDRYIIFKLCLLDSNKRKSVPCKHFTCMKKWTLSRTSHISEKRIRFAMSLRPSVHIEKLGFHCTDLKKIFQNFRKNVEKIHVLLNSEKDNGYFTRTQKHIQDKTATNSALKIETFPNEFIVKIKEGTLYLNTSLMKIVSFMRWFGKIWYRQTRNTWLYNKARVLWMLVT